MFYSMYFPLFLLGPALLSCCSGESSVHGPPEGVLALAGGDVILPCTFNKAPNDEFPTVEWSKNGLKPDVIFLYRDGCETYEMKNPAFQYRTSFVTKKLKDRNISLRISNVQLSDSGKYQCMRLWKNGHRDITTVELVVGAVSEPKLSVVSVEGGGLTLQCEASCWQPEPEIQFLDDQGNDIPANDPKRLQDASGCYTVTRRATVQEATSITCRVHQPDINETRETDSYSIPVISIDYMRSCLPIIGFAGGGIVLLLLVICGLAVELWKRRDKSADVQKLSVTRQSSDQSTQSGIYENKPLLHVRYDNVAKGVIEKLTKEVDDLKSKLHEKEEIIRQLESNKPQFSPVSCQLGQPTMVCRAAASTSSNPPKSEDLPQIQGPKPDISQQTSNPAPDHPMHSSPPSLSFDAAVSSSWSSANPSKKKHITRRMSDCGVRTGPTVPKLHRQLSLSTNRFMLLSDLSEEAEQLM